MLKSGIRYHVAGWIKDGQTIDLGGRSVTLYSTPGHTPDSVSILDDGGRRLFTGDIINRDVTLLDVPGSDVRAEGARCIVCSRSPRMRRWRTRRTRKSPLTRAELEQLAAGVDAIAAGTARWKPACGGGVSCDATMVGSFPIVLPAGPGTGVAAAEFIDRDHRLSRLELHALIKLDHAAFARVLASAAVAVRGQIHISAHVY